MIGSEIFGKLRRLPEMDGREIRYRLHESLQRGVERAAIHLKDLRGFGGLGDDEEGFLARLPGASFTEYLRESAASRFHVPADERGRRELAELFHRRFPERVPAVAAAAERLCAHRVELLGFGEVDLGPEIDWHRDPLTGISWQRRFWGDYDLVHDHPAGDPKRIHELARHQHLPRLGKAYFLLGDERYAEEAVIQMLGWIDQNPPGVGVHWHSSLEIALRAVSWLWTLFFVLPSAALDEAAARRIGRSLFRQLDHVHRYPSVFSSPNTHLLGEAAALYLAGRVFRDCRGADGWLTLGAEQLVTEAERQVLPDGVHAELATGYHAYALDFYLQALSLPGDGAAGEADLPALSARVAGRTEAMADFLLHVLRPDGTLPRLGDDDGGRALALDRTSYRRPGDLLATAAVLFGRSDFKSACRELPEETLWLLGREGFRRFRALEGGPPEDLHRSFPWAGYVIQRTGWRKRDSHLVFDCGGLGELGGGHGHADALAVSLFACGRELVTDPGTFVYNGQPEWRNAFRSTRAHATVTIDGRDQAEPADTFRWRGGTPVELLDDDVTFDGLDYVAAEHHGYARPPVGVVHRRRVLRVASDYWLLFDDFRAADPEADGREHEFELVYPLAPEAEVGEPIAAGPAAVRVQSLVGPAGLGLVVHASAPVEVEVVRGSRLPALGWVSGRYGEKRAAPVVLARFRARVPAAAISVLVPREARPGRLVRPWHGTSLELRGVNAKAAPALALEICRDGVRDLAVLSPGSPELEVDLGHGLGSAELARLRGETFWARFGAGGSLRRLLAVRAERFERGGRSYFTSPDAITHYRPAAAEAPSLRAAGVETTPCAVSQAS